NPWDVRRAPAGSSSGSAVAAAAGLCAGALGSDTGGSIRGPAAMTGLVGHKPTYGLVSRSGVLALSWSLDHVGPMTRGVWDSAVMLQAIAGADPDDTSTRHATTQDYVQHLEDGARGLRLGLLKRYYVDFPGLNDEVRGAALTAFDVLRKEGATIEDVDAPSLDLALAAWGCRSRSRSSAAGSTTPPCCASRAPTSASPTGTGDAPIPRAGRCDGGLSRGRGQARPARLPAEADPRGRAPAHSPGRAYDR